jgi:Tle cognate immunity protein 4 C-terminal domain/Tle cognate immunity protein 4 N-terminal domain
MNQPGTSGWGSEAAPVCVGRFLIDAPRGVTLRPAQGASGTATIHAEAPVALQDFQRRVQARWDVVRQRVLDDTGKPRVKPPESIDLGPQGTIFNFDHAVTRGPDVTGKVGEWSLHTTEGHLWRDGVAYTFDESDEAETRRTMQSLLPLAPEQVPTGPGFCGPRAFIPGPARAEFVALHAEWQASVPMALRVSTSTYVDRMGLNSLRPPKPNASSLPKEGKLRGHLLHEGQARHAGLDGQEWIVGYTEQKSANAYVTSVTAIWFAEGAASSSDKPALQIKLSASFPSAVPPEPWGAFPAAPVDAVGPPPQVEFMQAWRAVLASLRLRPGAL